MSTEHTNKPAQVGAVGIMGAGSIGCYLGGRLAQAGVPVVLIGRASLGEVLERQGLRLSDLQGDDTQLSPGHAMVSFADGPEALSDCGVVLVTVKSKDTRAIGELLAPHLAPGALVISFQNGLHNGRLLRESIQEHSPDPNNMPTVVQGMVSFNVLRRAPHHFHRGTEGPLVFAQSGTKGEAFAASLHKAGFDAFTHRDMAGIMAGKLILNLNNAVNALSGLTIEEQIRNRHFRRIMSAIMGEGLQVMKASGIKPRALGMKIRPRLAQKVLLLPDRLFFFVARQMLAIDPEARSSMWEDLQRGRITEVNELNEEIVRLGQANGCPAPWNAHLVQLVRQAESQKNGSPGLPLDSFRPDGVGVR